MTTLLLICMCQYSLVVEAYRLDRYDNDNLAQPLAGETVVEAYRLDRYDNSERSSIRTSAISL